MVARDQAVQGNQDEPVGDEPEGSQLRGHHNPDQNGDGDKAHGVEDMEAEDQHLPRDRLLLQVGPLLFFFILILSYWHVRPCFDFFDLHCVKPESDWPLFH